VVGVVNPALSNVPRPIAQVAEFTGLSRSWIRRQVRAGVIPAYGSERKWRVAPADAVAAMRRQRVKPTSHARARLAQVLDREAREQ